MSMRPRALAIARLLEAVGERPRRGERIICGAICSGLLDPGGEVEVTVGRVRYGPGKSRTVPG